MANPVCEVLLSEKTLAAPTETLPPETGAVVDFWGVVRGTENGDEISGIEYEAHRAMAEHQLRMIGEAAIAQFDLRLLVIHHRLSFVPVGEASLFVRAGTQHRAEGFRASEWIVEELKKRAPIWKRPQGGAAS